MRERPVKCPGYVWCDHHCGIHQSHSDVFDEGADECRKENWRTVFVVGVAGEFG